MSSHHTAYLSHHHHHPHPAAMPTDWAALQPLSVQRVPSPPSDMEQSPTSSQPRKVANTFMMYKNDFPLRYPEVCALEKAPSQRMRIAARLWEQEPASVKDEYERRYRAAMLAAGAKAAEADYNRRKARSESVTAARRLKRESEGATLSPRSDYIVNAFSSGLRGDALIRVVREWDASNAPEPATKRKRSARAAATATSEPVAHHQASPTPSPPTTPSSAHALPAVYSAHANAVFTQHQQQHLHAQQHQAHHAHLQQQHHHQHQQHQHQQHNPMMMPTSYTGYRPSLMPQVPQPIPLAHANYGYATAHPHMSSHHVQQMQHHPYVKTEETGYPQPGWSSHSYAPTPQYATYEQPSYATYVSPYDLHASPVMVPSSSPVMTSSPSSVSSVDETFDVGVGVGAYTYAGHWA